MAEKMKKRIIVGATGASGLPLLVKMSGDHPGESGF